MSEEIKEQELNEEVEVTGDEPIATADSAMDAIVFDPTAPIISVKKLADAGVHYGHLTRKWNPKMKEYIYTSRNKQYLIDLEKTVQGLTSAYAALKEIVVKGGKVLIVGTKEAIIQPVKDEAERAGAFSVTTRWLGGTLTNFKVLQSRIKYLQELQQQEESGYFLTLPKKEASRIMKEKAKLENNFDGIKEMRKIPNAVVVVDSTKEYNAIREAKKVGIPVFAIVNTSSDPDGIDYVIPGNDTATKSVKLLLQVLADAIVEAKGGIPQVAYMRSNEEDITMKDALKQYEQEHKARMDALKQQRKERREAAEKAQQERENRRQERLNANKKPREDGNKPAEGEAKAEKGEEKPAKPARKPAAKKPAAKKEDTASEKKEEVSAEKGE